MSEFGVRKILLITKTPTEKIGALVVPQIHLKKVKSSAFYYVKGKMRDYVCKNSNPSRVSVMINVSKAGDI